MSDQPAPAKDALEQPLRVVWTLAWPAVALNALQTVNSLLDSYFIQHLEPAALTAISSATTAMFLVISMTMAVGVAATAMVSRAFGEGDMDKVREANQKCLGFAVIFAFILMLFVWPLGDLVASFMVPRSNPRAATMMVEYLRISGLMLPGMFVIQTLAGSLRGTGDTRSPMVISGLQILLHIALNYLLIFPSRSIGPFVLPGAGLGLHGAAVALVVSATCSAVVYLAWCSRTPLGNVWKIRNPGLDWMRRIVKLAVPAALMSIVRVTSLMAFMAILSHVPNGDLAIGAVRPAFSLEALAFMPSFGLAIAASALVGQSLGMGDPARASRLGWMAAHQAGLVSLVAAVFLFVFAQPVSSLVLADKPEFAAYTAQYLRYVCTTEVLFGYSMVLVSAMQGAGDTTRPFWLTVWSGWLLRVPLAAILALTAIQVGPWAIAGAGMGADGCWLAIAIAQSLGGIGAIWLWMRGDWRYAKV